MPAYQGRCIQLCQYIKVDTSLHEKFNGYAVQQRYGALQDRRNWEEFSQWEALGFGVFASQSVGFASSDKLDEIFKLPLKRFSCRGSGCGYSP